MKAEVLHLESNLLFEGGGESTTHNWKVIFYVKSEVLDLESNLLFLGGGGVICYTKLEVLEFTKQENVNGRSC